MLASKVFAYVSYSHSRVGPSETFAYAIGKSFTIGFSQPFILQSLFYRPRFYYTGEDCEEVIKLYRDKTLVGSRKIDGNRDTWQKEAFYDKHLIDTIEFPGNFDFDNIYLTLELAGILEEFKLDYFKQLLNTERSKLTGEENEVKELIEVAITVSKKVLRCNMDPFELEQALKGSSMEDPIMIKLLGKIKSLFTTDDVMLT